MEDSEIRKYSIQNGEKLPENAHFSSGSYSQMLKFFKERAEELKIEFDNRRKEKIPLASDIKK